MHILAMDFCVSPLFVVLYTEVEYTVHKIHLFCPVELKMIIVNSIIILCV